MTENVQPNDDRVSVLKAEYFDLFLNVNVESNQQRHNNWVELCYSLFILRERLLKFIEKTFTKVIEECGLNNSKKSQIRQRIKDRVRTTPPPSSKSLENPSDTSLVENTSSTSLDNPSDTSLENTSGTSTESPSSASTEIPSSNSKKRASGKKNPLTPWERKVKDRKKIKDLNETQITAAWGTFAKCYTGTFVMQNAKKRKELKIEEADLKELLEVLMYCSCFGGGLYDAAYEVVEYRNKYYGHTPGLYIDSDSLKNLISAIESLTNY